jgi:hypothetical protein
MGNRPSGDVDLFTSWQHRGEFPELTAAVIAALEAAGYKVSVIMSAETFTQITDAAFAEYRTEPGMIADIRHRFAQWRHELLAAASS